MAKPLLDVIALGGKVFEARGRVLERQLDEAGGAVTLFGDDYLGDASEAGSSFL